MGVHPARGGLRRRGRKHPRVQGPAGRSEYAPVALNNSNDGKAKNRRIEVVLTPKLDEISKLLKIN